MVMYRMAVLFFLITTALSPAAAAVDVIGKYADQPYACNSNQQTEAWKIFKSIAAQYPEFCETYNPAEIVPLMRETPDVRSEKEKASRLAFTSDAVEIGKRLLLYAEKGLGDTLMWVRYVSHLITKYPRLRVEVSVQKPLLCLQELLPGVTFVSGVDPNDSAYDYCLSLFELPLILSAGLPDGNAYLSVPSTLDEAAKAEISSTAQGRFKIGLCFRGDKRHRYNEERSLHLADFMSLIRAPGVCLFSLQVGDGQEEVKDFPEVVDLSSKLTSIAHTAAYVKNMDLVITIDSMLGHLAGAIITSPDGAGVPTVELLCPYPDLRWISSFEKTSPWYKGHALYRKKAEQSWRAVIDKVLNEYPGLREKAMKTPGVLSMQIGGF